MIQQFHSWIYIQKEKKITNLKRYMNAYVHSSTIHNRQHMQATQLPISRQMDKEDAVHTHTHAHTRARAHTHTHGYYSATYSNMDGPKRTCCIYSTGNSTQYSVNGLYGKRILEKASRHIHTYIYIYTHVIHLPVHLKLTQHCKSTILLIKIKKNKLGVCD